MDPLKYLMEKPVQDGKIAKWVLLLSQFDLKATNQNGNGIRGLLISLKGTHISFSGRLNFPTTNNATKCEACIMGLQAALSLGVEELEVYGDSAMIICQIQNRWKTKEEKLMPYHECLQKLASKFGEIQYQYVPRMQN
ncbi:uncharacterized protein LOC142605764 [Castanea sativa]|uniref:uncharacterized protein LOC142605764 n=1 Tax=Castanea sativa TaxID=21020 RepID=UPI003F64A82C